jgi:hypothetical protein
MTISAQGKKDIEVQKIKACSLELAFHFAHLACGLTFNFLDLAFFFFKVLICDLIPILRKLTTFVLLLVILPFTGVKDGLVGAT